jgi:hypothetical protein
MSWQVAIEQQLIMVGSGDNSGSHHAAMSRGVQTCSAWIPAVKRLARPHPASYRHRPESHGMQEVRGSNPRSSTRNSRSECRSEAIWIGFKIG